VGQTKKGKVRIKTEKTWEEELKGGKKLSGIKVGEGKNSLGGIGGKREKSGTKKGKRGEVQKVGQKGVFEKQVGGSI